MLTHDLHNKSFGCQRDFKPIEAANLDALCEASVNSPQPVAHIALLSALTQ
jgi:hypothetical protein